MNYCRYNNELKLNKVNTQLYNEIFCIVIIIIYYEINWNILFM